MISHATVRIKCGLNRIRRLWAGEVRINVSPEDNYQFTVPFVRFNRR